MSSNPHQFVKLRRQLHQLLRDRSSGAADIAVRAAELMELGKRLELSPQRLSRMASRIEKAHAAMGSVWNAVRSEEPARFARQSRVHVRNTVAQARRILPRSGAVLTLSRSGTIIDVIGRKQYHVTVAESIPGGEGVGAARSLRRAGAAVDVIPDSAVVAAAQHCDFAVVGADAITPSHVVNKIGTYLLALACRECNIPAYVVADGTKLVPDDWSLPEPSPTQIFEAIPRAHFTKVICDSLMD